MKVQRKRIVMKLSSFVFVILLFIMILVGTLPAFGQGTSNPKAITIEKLKSIDLSKRDKITLQQEYLVEGYFVNDPIPMLVKDLKIVLANTPMPKSAYIILKGKGIDKFLEQKMAYGSMVKVRGKLIADTKLTKGKITHILICPEVPEIIKKPTVYKPEFINLCKKYPLICKFPPFKSSKYALLYSSGVNPVNAHRRYWNDLKFMYLTLRSKYGFTDDRIVVVYKDGTGEDTDITVDYAASPTGFNDAIKYLRSHMTLRDDLFLFVTNHGGGYHDKSCGEVEASWGGRADGIPGDEIDTYTWDEQIWYYNQISNDVWDDDFANLINSLNFKTMIGVFEQCFSGGFLRDLKGCNRILISAATEFQFSWAMGPQYNYDAFSYYFTCALNNADDSGAALSTNPDTNGDGNISILEAFQYAKSKDTECETLQIEDNGDGIGTNSPSATGTDGQLAANTHL